MRDIRRNIVSGLIFIVVSVLYFRGTFSFIEISRHSEGSKFLPRIYATLLFVTVLTLVVKSLLAYGREKRKEAETEAKEAAPAPNYARVAVTLVLIAVYAYLFSKIGFISSTVLYLAVHMIVLAGGRRERVPRILVVSVLTALGLYFLFGRVFLIPFPYGSLF